MKASLHKWWHISREGKWKYSGLHFVVYLNGLILKRKYSECIYVSVLKEQVKFQKVISSIYSCVQFGPNIAIKVDLLYSSKTPTRWCAEKLENPNVSQGVRQRIRKCVAAPSRWLESVLPQHQDHQTQGWWFYAVLVKVRLAHWWCAYYQSQQQSVQNYLIMLKTQSSKPLSPDPSSLNTAYAESRATRAAVVGLTGAASALIKSMAAELWQAIN